MADVDENTELLLLYRYVSEAKLEKNASTQERGGSAQVEIDRRSRKKVQKEWDRRFNLESKERTNTQKFQKAQVDRQIETANEQLVASKNIAKRQLVIATLSAVASVGSAVAALALVFLTWSQTPG